MMATPGQPWPVTRPLPALRHLAEVVSVLVARDQRARFRSTAMGVVWAVASPLLFLMTFYVLFVFILPIEVPNYAAHLFIGIVVWSWFNGATVEAMGSIVGNAGLVGLPGFPVLALPVAAVVSNLVTLVLTLPVLLVILYAEGTAFLGPALLALPVLLAVAFVLFLAISVFAAALNVTFRDMQYIVPILLQLGYFLTPIFYDRSTLAEPARGWLAWNPLAQIIDAFRAVLIRGEWPDWQAIAIVFAVAVVVMVLGTRYFLGARHRFLQEI